MENAPRPVGDDIEKILDEVVKDPEVEAYGLPSLAALIRFAIKRLKTPQ